MRLRSALLTTTALLLAGAAGFAAARSLQDGGEAMTALQPTEMHRWMATHHGTWDCQVEGSMGSSSATWVSEAGPGGLWNLGTFKGEMMGMPFEGREFQGYDPATERFTSVWIDSWTLTPMVLEGSYDATARSMVLKGETPGPDGQPVPMTHVTNYPDADTMVFTMHAPGPDGQPAELMKITYKRRR
jgi:hypothetical protein